MAIDYRTEPEYWEYLDGEVHPKVSPRQRHAVVQGKMLRIISEFGEKYGQIGTEWDVWLPDHERLTKFIPDVSYFSFARLRAMSEEDREFPPCAPDIAVEVLSPGDSPAYLARKIELYLSHGSLVVFDVDPLERTITVHTQHTSPRTLRGVDVFADPSVPWLTFSVADAFANLDIPAK